MAGHSRWANIQRRESAQARRRGRDTFANPAARLERVRFEGYGPGGSAVMVDCLTPDPARSGALLRSTFHRYGGHLGADGSVRYLFNTVGLMTYPPGTDEEQLMRVALEAGAEDVVPSDDCSVEVLADPIEFDTVRAVLVHSGFVPATAQVTQRAANPLELTGESAELMAHLLAALEELDEVQDVYSNVEISDEVLARI